MYVCMMEGSGIVLSWRYLGWLIETGYKEGVVEVSDGIKEGKEGEIPRIEYRIRFMDGRYNRSRIKVVMNIDRRETGEDLIRVHVPEVVNGHGPMVYSISDVYGSVKVTGSNQSGTKHPLRDKMTFTKIGVRKHEFVNMGVFLSSVCQQTRGFIDQS